MSLAVVITQQQAPLSHPHPSTPILSLTAKANLAPNTTSKTRSQEYSDPLPYPTICVFTYPLLFPLVRKRRNAHLFETVKTAVSPISVTSLSPIALAPDPELHTQPSPWLPSRFDRLIPCGTSPWLGLTSPASLEPLKLRSPVSNMEIQRNGFHL